MIYLSERTYYSIYSAWHGLSRFKDLTRRTASAKILRDKVFDTAKNLKHDGYKCGLASMVSNFLIKNPLVK